MAIPSIFPLNSGITRDTAVAAPVVVGTMDMAAARARRRSECGKSSITWSLVYAWVVVIRPYSMPNSSERILAMGARQLVVQEPMERI